MAQYAWGAKRERQYEHIKEALRSEARTRTRRRRSRPALSTRNGSGRARRPAARVGVTGGKVVRTWVSGQELVR